MPRIKSYAPAWLNEPAPGHRLFATSNDLNTPASQQYGAYRSKPGPRRTIARRGTEVFVASGKQIRWGDLVHLKDAWESKSPKAWPGVRVKREDSDGSFDVYDDELGSSGQNGMQAEGYRVCILSDALSIKWRGPTNSYAFPTDDQNPSSS
jgi:nucleoporin NUP82